MKSSIVLGLSLASVAMGSPGDDLDDFKDCVEVCDITTCGGLGNYPDVTKPAYDMMMKDQKETQRFVEMPLNLDLLWLGWKCYPNCDYQCQRIVTLDRRENGLEEFQFHGKWPFIRVWGIQELFSALFSVLNFVPHYQGFRLMYKHYRKDFDHGLKESAHIYWAYMVVGLIASLAWVFSTIFHIRDTWTREQLDYYFAGMTVMSGLYAVTTRYFQLYLSKNDTKRRALAALIAVIYCCHIARLMIDWSYTYNMRFNVFFGLIQDVLWFLQAFTTFWPKRKHNNLTEDIQDPSINWMLTPIALVLAVSGGMMFELFDFPPFFDLIDAHALWHLATIVPAYYWYPYMNRDVEEDVKQRKAA